MGDKRIDTLPKDISLKVNVRERLEFELSYYNVTVQHVSHYPMETSPLSVISTTIFSKVKCISRINLQNVSEIQYEKSAVSTSQHVRLHYAWLINLVRLGM